MSEKYLGDPVRLLPKSKHLLLDADTLIHRAANSSQENRFRVVGEEKGFQGKRKLWADLEKRGIDKDSVEIEEYVHKVAKLETATDNLYYEVNKILRQPWVRDYTLFIEDVGNFREEAATLIQYKGHRPDKPVLFNEIREFFLKQWAGKVVTSKDQETDDTVSIAAWAEYNKARLFRDRNMSDVVVGFVDKDLQQIAGFHWNYLKADEPVTWMNDVEAYRWFCWQMLLGDKADNIAGLTKWSKELSAQYGLRKIAGLGEVGCWSLVDGYNTKRDLAQRVIDIYKSVYGTDKFEFVSWTGETMLIDWKYIANENGVLLHMRQFEGEQYVFTEEAEALGCDV